MFGWTPSRLKKSCGNMQRVFFIVLSQHQVNLWAETYSSQVHECIRFWLRKLDFIRLRNCCILMHHHKGCYRWHLWKLMTTTVSFSCWGNSIAPLRFDSATAHLHVQSMFIQKSSWFHWQVYQACFQTRYAMHPCSIYTEEQCFCRPDYWLLMLR